MTLTLTLSRSLLDTLSSALFSAYCTVAHAACRLVAGLGFAWVAGNCGWVCWCAAGDNWVWGRASQIEEGR